MNNLRISPSFGARYAVKVPEGINVNDLFDDVARIAKEREIKDWHVSDITINNGKGHSHHTAIVSTDEHTKPDSDGYFRILREVGESSRKEKYNENLSPLAKGILQRDKFYEELRPKMIGFIDNLSKLPDTIQTTLEELFTHK